MILYIILTLLGIFVYKYLVKPYRLFLKYKKYGEGFYFPLIGEVLMQSNCVQKFNDADYIFKHFKDTQNNDKKVFVENMGKDIKIKIANMDLAKDFYQLLGGDSLVLDPFYTQNFTRLFGNGLLFSNGEQWRNLRKIFSPAFHFDYMKSLNSSIEKIVDDVFQSYIDSNNLEKVNLTQLMAEISSQVIIFSFFGDTLKGAKFQHKTLSQAITLLLSAIAKQVMEVGYLIFGVKFLQLGLFREHREVERYLREFKKYLSDTIKSKTQILKKEFEETGDIKQNCILSILIKDKTIDTLSDTDLLDNFMTFFIAGTDTTSHLVAMTIYYISKYNDYHKVLQREIDYYSLADTKSIHDLPFLNASIKETLRMYGPGNKSFDRKVVDDIQIGDMKIEKGLVITNHMSSVHRDPTIFKDPHVFKPQRWVQEETNNLPPYAFLPFSSGKKNCIGQHLAQIEARIMLFKFIQKFDFEIPEDYTLKLQYSLLPEPVNPLLFNLKVRKTK